MDLIGDSASDMDMHIMTQLHKYSPVQSWVYVYYNDPITAIWPRTDMGMHIMTQVQQSGQKQTWICQLQPSYRHMAQYRHGYAYYDPVTDILPNTDMDMPIIVTQLQTYCPM